MFLYYKLKKHQNQFRVELNIHLWAVKRCFLYMEYLSLNIIKIANEKFRFHQFKLKTKCNLFPSSVGFMLIGHSHMSLCIRKLPRAQTSRCTPESFPGTRFNTQCIYHVFCILYVYQLRMVLHYIYCILTTFYSVWALK